MTFALVTKDGSVISLAVGQADVEQGIAMTPTHVMPAGSIGKSFVAATVLALAGEGTLSLDDEISRWLGSKPWFEGIPNGQDVTLRMLLNQSSGITADYIDTPVLEEPFAYSLDGYGARDLAEQGITHDDFGRAIATTKAGFPAGTSYGYSDSNYVLAGLIIEEATGLDYYAEVDRRFLRPLGLATITPSRRIVDNLASGYEPDATRLPFLPPKISENGRFVLDPAIEWTGGGFMATATDLARWAFALYGGRAMSNPYVAEMIASVNPYAPDDAGYHYGPGVIVTRDDALGLRLNHGGYFFGYSSFMEYLPDHDMALAFQFNTRRGYREYRTYADALWREIGVGG